jgi:hypothetical protein
MITEEQLIEMGFTPVYAEDFKFYQRQLTSDEYLIADIFETGWEVTVGEIADRISEASDVKQIIEIFNRATNGKS